MTVKILPNHKGNPPTKLADAELHFDGAEAARELLSTIMDTIPNPNRCGPVQTLLHTLKALDGLKLIGFAIWQRRSTDSVNRGPLNVTFPARNYAVNGERRSFALLRPASDMAAQGRVRDMILAAYHDMESGDDGT